MVWPLMSSTLPNLETPEFDGGIGAEVDFLTINNFSKVASPNIRYDLGE